MTTFKRLTIGLAVVAVTRCVPASGQVTAPAPVSNPLQLTIAYPAAGSALEFGDSTFLFGRLGNGSATLRINGQAIPVSPDGAWLAWVALPRDSSFVVNMLACRGDECARGTLPLSRAHWVRERGAWVDRASMSPAGKNIWLPTGEPLPLTVRAAPGATVRLILGKRDTLKFRPDSIGDAPREGLRAFDHDDRNLAQSARGDRYVATLRSDVNPSKAPWDSTGPQRITTIPQLEVVLNGQVTRVPWELDVTHHATPAVSVVLGPPTPGPGGAARPTLGGNDRITIGRAAPTGTYTWFLPTGTRTHADMRIGDQVRLRLSRDAIAWVPLENAHRASAADDERRAVVGSPTLTPDSGRTRLRIPLTRVVPMSVDEGDRALTITLFDAVSDANWTRYGADQRFVKLLTWKQEAEDRVTLSVTFDQPLWGWRSHVDGTDLVFEFREPPRVDPAQPLRGRRIVVDPGHPPGGACGPTGLCEPEANLNIANAVRDQLVAAGATVIMTRTGPGDVGLWPRVALADSLDAEMLISIHNNAFPDGVNPFTNGGTSTFFNHPHSLALARAVQTRLVANLGLRDLGVARGDLALTRPTWYPAILTEGMHMMFPEQEAALRTLDGQRRYATGIVQGITAFLHDVPSRSRGP